MTKIPWWPLIGGGLFVIFGTIPFFFAGVLHFFPNLENLSDPISKLGDLGAVAIIIINSLYVVIANVIDIVREIRGAIKDAIKERETRVPKETFIRYWITTLTAWTLSYVRIIIKFVIGAVLGCVARIFPGIAITGCFIVLRVLGIFPDFPKLEFESGFESGTVIAGILVCACWVYLFLLKLKKIRSPASTVEGQEYR